MLVRPPLFALFDVSPAFDAILLTDQNRSIRSHRLPTHTETVRDRATLAQDIINAGGAFLDLVVQMTLPSTTRQTYCSRHRTPFYRPNSILRIRNAIAGALSQVTYSGQYPPPCPRHTAELSRWRTQMLPSP